MIKYVLFLIFTIQSFADCPCGTTQYTYSCPAGCTISVTSGTSSTPPANNCKCPSSPSCPSGGTYNTSSKNCEYIVQQNPSCESGWSYNSSSSKCERTVSYTPTCSSGSLNTATDQCVSSGCPSGTTQSGNTCCHDVTTTGYTCPSGGTLNGTICNDEEWVMEYDCWDDGEDDYCIPSMQFMSRNPSGRCPLDYYVFNYRENPQTWQCGIRKPVSYAATLTTTTSTVCTGLTIYSSSPTCPSGGAYNGSSNQCERLETYSTSCSAGWTYNAAIDKCERTLTHSPNCSDGTYNNDTDKCEYYTHHDPYCSGRYYTYNGTRYTSNYGNNGICYGEAVGYTECKNAGYTWLNSNVCYQNPSCSSTADGRKVYRSGEACYTLPACPSTVPLRTGETCYQEPYCSDGSYDSLYSYKMYDSVNGYRYEDTTVNTSNMTTGLTFSTDEETRNGTFNINTSGNVCEKYTYSCGSDANSQGFDWQLYGITDHPTNNDSSNLAGTTHFSDLNASLKSNNPTILTNDVTFNDNDDVNVDSGEGAVCCRLDRTENDNTPVTETISGEEVGAH